ncbi:phosphate ABC transporter permease subunit PstC [Verrucomicrobia bacterium LW23]|nr:phosphate ABC transporter permease subunit PstC [Verrucomicrobia bacterium LW23]
MSASPKRQPEIPPNSFPDDLYADLCKREVITDDIAGRIMLALSTLSILAVVLIFVFVAKECLPVLTGQTSTVRSGKTIDPETAAKMPAEEIAAYLQQPVPTIRSLTPDVLKQLVALRNEELAGSKNSDDALNTTSWALMLMPHQWQGYSEPAYIWQPTSKIEKYNLVPLFLGTCKVAFIALVIAVPLALLAAIYVSQIASVRVREIMKPLIELLAGVPSVVLGFLALIALATIFQSIFHYEARLNSFVAGFALAFAVIPLIFTVAEDALSAVPRAHKDAALALGATEWECAWRVMVPAALPGIFAAVVLGFGRAIGETMVVLFASGNSSIMSLSPFDSVRTITATIGSELADAASGSAHYQVLFLIGGLLFLITFTFNLLADLAIGRLRSRIEALAGRETYSIIQPKAYSGDAAI